MPHAAHGSASCTLRQQHGLRCLVPTSHMYCGMGAWGSSAARINHYFLLGTGESMEQISLARWVCMAVTGEGAQPH